MCNPSKGGEQFAAVAKRGNLTNQRQARHSQECQPMPERARCFIGAYDP